MYPVQWSGHTMVTGLSSMVRGAKPICRADYGGWFEFDDARSEAYLRQAQLPVARSEADLFQEEWFAGRGVAWFVDMMLFYERTYDVAGVGGTMGK